MFVNGVIGENDMTLYQKLQDEIRNHRDFWNYYDMKVEDVCKNEKSASKFIYKFFESGSKSYAIREWMEYSDDSMQMRNIHTINVFFIGVFLQRKIDENIAIKSEMSSDYTFSYLWYLLCLAHDLGYIYENRLGRDFKMPNENMIKKQIGLRKSISRRHFYRCNKIKVTYLCSAFWLAPLIRSNHLNDGFHNIQQELNRNIEYSNGTMIKKPRYSGRILNRYFYYRLHEWNKVDHGIIGGDLFLSRMIVNYKKEYMKVMHRSHRVNCDYEFYNERGLYFCCEQLKIFDYISNCIASHNIYMANDDEYKRKYIEYSLDCLLEEQYKRISYKDDPLLFILCVADTLEPSKRFIKYNSETLLRLIDIDYDVTQNLLNIKIDMQLCRQDEGIKYISDIKNLEQWCDIKVKIKVL